MITLIPPLTSPESVPSILAAEPTSPSASLSTSFAEIYSLRWSSVFPSQISAAGNRRYRIESGLALNYLSSCQTAEVFGKS
ncbi:hypothetical protein C8J55DRAFT_501467 [Lentinula edodes]|uniref:Uncharacterized protein n=1 Tax=Lentinula lateritia TaxID=40482 RepID=A0A9W9AXP4_9AGAR|nr:hypothetical protein C8J55DRAFT_501467 [Lentinula edodes]